VTLNPTQSDGSGARGAWAWWPLRFLVFFVVLLLVYAGSQVLVIVVAPKWHLAAPDIVQPVGGLLTIGATILVYCLLVRWMERRAPSELALSRAVPQVLGGALLGIVLFSAVYAVLWAMGVATFKGFGTADGLMLALGMALMAGVCEELIFRGAVYRLFESGFGTAVALILSGALFGLLHAANPGATLASTFAIALEAGVLLAAAYVLTRSLWLPIGLHFGWNFTEGGIFGAAVSGHATKGLIDASISGPVLLTGGKFGPEASLPAVAVCVTTAIVILVLAAQRGQWQPLRFRLRAA
jgi:membrane protease YdiL (CAAX protease family)